MAGFVPEVQLLQACSNLYGDGNSGSSSSSSSSSSSISSSGSIHIRVRLSESLLPPPLPAEFKSSQVASETSETTEYSIRADWNDFWAHLHPTMCQAKRCEATILRVRIGTMVLAYVLIVVLIVLMGAWAHGMSSNVSKFFVHVIGTVLNYGVVVGAVQLFCRWQGRTIYNQLQQLMTAIQYYEKEHCIQQQYGWNIQCQHESGLGFTLLMANNVSHGDENASSRASDEANLPAGIRVQENGSLCILLSTHTAWGIDAPVTLSHLSDLACVESRRHLAFPPGFESLAAALLSDASTVVMDSEDENDIDQQSDNAVLQQFWLDIVMASRTYQQARSTAMIGIWMATAMTLQSILPHFHFPAGLLSILILLRMRYNAAAFAKETIGAALNRHETLLRRQCGYSVYYSTRDVHEFVAPHQMMYGARYLTIVPSNTGRDDGS